MHHTLLSALFILACLSALAQPGGQPAAARRGQLQVIYVMGSDNLEQERLNLENDTLITDFVTTVQGGLNYAMTIRRLPKTNFTTKALRDTIAALRTNPEDVIILYYAGRGVDPAKPGALLANWKLDDVKTAGLPVTAIETWLKAQKAHLSVVIADYSTEQIQSIPLDALTILSIDLRRQIIQQLFIRRCGIVKLGSSAPSKPAYINTSAGPGSAFTAGLRYAFSSMLSAIDPADLPNLSFSRLQRATGRAIGLRIGSGGYEQTTVLDETPCTPVPAGLARPEAGQTPDKNLLNTAGMRWQGLRMNDYDYDDLPRKSPTRSAKPLPVRVDLSRYAPPVINQGEKGTCVAVSIGYYMRSILEARRLGITDKKEILKRSGSPFYLYNALKYPTDARCTFGVDAGQTLSYLKEYGLPAFSTFPDPNFCQTQPMPRMYASARIQDYVKLFRITEAREAKVQAVRQTLAEGAPVVVGIETTGSIGNLSFVKTLVPRLRNAVSTLIFTDGSGSSMQWQPYQANSLAFGHAMCVVGYDNTMFGGTGAFKLINSWGPTWGDSGYFWISYENFGRFAKYGYQAYIQTGSPTVLDTDLTIWKGAYRQSPLAFAPVPTRTPIQTYAITRPQRTGTSFKFRVDVKKRTYLYLITASTGDSATVKLLPAPGYKTIIAPGNRVDYPSDNASLKLSGRAGLEYWLFLLSTTELSDIDEKVRDINQQKGPFPDRVLKAFGNTLVQRGRVAYKPKKMGFFLPNQPNGGGQVVPLLVTLNHVP